MRNAFRRAGLYSSLVASLLLVITALTMNTPASADSESDSAGPAPGERNFTIPGPEIKRSEILIDGSTGETAQTTTDNSRLQGEITDDGEDAFDAMVAVFEEKYPRTISFGGMSLDGSGIRWLLIPDAPTADQVEIFKTYGLPLRIKYGNAPTPDEMRALAGTMRLVSLAGGPITFQGYGFNADHTGLEVRYSASSDLSQADLEAKARDLVVNGLKQLGRELTFDVDFIETPGPMLDVTADITGGYGLTNSSSTAVCTSGFTATRNGNLGVISAKHCPNSLQYRGNAGSLDFGAPASDSTEGEVDMQFHRTLGSNTTSKKYQHYNGDDRFVTSVTTQTATDSGETRCHQGITTRFGCALLDDIGFCGYAAWGGTTHYVCHLVSTTNQVDDLGDSGGPWFDDTPGKAVGIHHGHVNGGDASVFTNINRASINLSATVRTN